MTNMPCSSRHSAAEWVAILLQGAPGCHARLPIAEQGDDCVGIFISLITSLL